MQCIAVCYEPLVGTRYVECSGCFGDLGWGTNRKCQNRKGYYNLVSAVNHLNDMMTRIKHYTYH